LPAPSPLVAVRRSIWLSHLGQNLRVSRKEGVALLVTYSFYLCALVFLAAGLKK
jgi:hypothetical protein